MQTCELGGLSCFLEAVMHNRIDWAKCPPSVDPKSSAARLHMTAKPMEGFAMSSGIYQITNRANGKRYIGSAVNPRRRWQDHLSNLRRGKHCNVHLQRAFDKHGRDAFIFSVLEHVESEKLIEREQHYLDTLLSEYNIAPTAGNQLGFQHTDKTRRKMSAAHKGKCLSEETKRKLSEAQRGERGNNYGKHPSNETREKLSEAHKGKRLNKETRRKISKALKGKIVSEETRTKLSMAQRGKRHSETTKRKMRQVWSLERRQARSNELRGKHLSEETRRKLSIAHKGKHHTKETRAKMSEVQKVRWKRIRAAKSQELGEATE